MPAGWRMRSVNTQARGDSRGMEQSGGESVLSNMNLTLEGKEKIPGGWNFQREANITQHNHGPVKGALEKKIMITGGWNSQRKASITKQDPCHIEDAMKENEMIPGGWNRQREASNIEQYSGPVAGPLEEEMISGG